MIGMVERVGGLVGFLTLEEIAGWWREGQKEKV